MEGKIQGGTLNGFDEIQDILMPDSKNISQSILSTNSSDIDNESLLKTYIDVNKQKYEDFLSNEKEIEKSQVAKISKEAIDKIVYIENGMLEINTGLLKFPYSKERNEMVKENEEFCKNMKERYLNDMKKEFNKKYEEFELKCSFIMAKYPCFNDFKLLGKEDVDVISELEGFHNGDHNDGDFKKNAEMYLLNLQKMKEIGDSYEKKIKEKIKAMHEENLNTVEELKIKIKNLSKNNQILKNLGEEGSIISKTLDTIKDDLNMDNIFKNKEELSLIKKAIFLKKNPYNDVFR